MIIVHVQRVPTYTTRLNITSCPAAVNGRNIADTALNTIYNQSINQSVFRFSTYVKVKSVLQR